MSGPTGFPAGENPFQAPLASSGPDPFSPAGGIRSGPPWEQTERPLVGRYVETVTLAYTNTMVLFADMRREGGFGAPLLFAMIGGVIGGVIGTIPQIFLQLVMTGAQAGQADAQAVGLMAGMGVGMALAMMVFIPIGVVIATFLWSGIYHLMLLLLGAANFPYETTFRVIAYAGGASSLLLAIPFCGQYVSGIVGIVFYIIGLMKAQEISGMKATAAVLLPMVICCGLIFAVVAAAIGIGVAAGSNF
ncbi:MAG: YIP1 family protein [Pirellulales bacterium]|nr:YIP1 family protein [Pirellulales bacterium]